MQGKECVNHEGHEGSRRPLVLRFPSCTFVAFVVKVFPRCRFALNLRFPPARVTEVCPVHQ